MTSAPNLDSTRRSFLQLVGFGGLMCAVRCDPFDPNPADAYAPWDFPDGHSPHLECVHAATLAASPHNTQPWQFRLRANAIDLIADRSRWLGALDPLHRELHIGLGCALENLLIAARHLGRGSQANLFPDATDPTWVAEIPLEAQNPTEEPLFRYLRERHTNRGRYAEFSLPDLGDRLRGLWAESEGVDLRLLIAPVDKRRFADATLRATEAIVSDAEMNEASHAWYRHSKEEIARYRDGITLNAAGLSGLTTALGKSLARPSAAKSGAYWVDSTRRQTETVSAFALLSTRDLQHLESWLRVGQVFQRIHLECTRLGLALQPLNQLVERRDRELAEALSTEFGDTLRDWVPDGWHAQQLFRIGIAWEEAQLSPRRPLESVTEGSS